MQKQKPLAATEKKLVFALEKHIAEQAQFSSFMQVSENQSSEKSRKQYWQTKNVGALYCITNHSTNNNIATRSGTGDMEQGEFHLLLLDMNLIWKSFP